MDNAYEQLKFAAGIVITLVLVAIGFSMFQQATRAGNEVLNNINPEITEKIAKYDGVEVSGSEVINAIKRYQNEYSIKIVIGSNMSTYTGQFKLIENKPGQLNYISPAKAYVGTVEKDSNGFVTKLEFKEK